MKWIWTEKDKAPCFAEFKLPFEYNGGELVLKISAEYRYIAYINGKFVANGQYPDVPWFKAYDEINVTDFVQTGANELRVQAFHMGIDGFVARADIPCVAFEIYCNGKCLCGSDENTFARELVSYSVGARTTPQLGYGFCYDFTVEETQWGRAVVKDTRYQEVPRPLPKTKIDNEIRGVVSAQGAFVKHGGKTEAEIVQNCYMRTITFEEMTGEFRTYNYTLKAPIKFSINEGDGVFVIVDLGRESVGFPRFKISVKENCKAYLCWGEHLQDLRIRAHVGPRNFAYGFTFKAGENEFTEYFRRIGGRYMGLYVESRELTVEKIGVLEEEYPFSKPQKDFGDRLLNRIYETGRRTMELCAHDHYEDCPWREQALYTGDSRLQMKFGYGAFGEHAMPKESLRLMAISIEEDGLIPIATPSKDKNLNIPAGAFYWIVGLYEYVEETNDLEFLREMLPYAERVMDAYELRTTDKGIMQFKETRYWNFHEWTDGLTGPLNGAITREVEIEPEADGLLTAIGAYTTARLIKLFELTGNQEKVEKYTKYKNFLCESLENFYDAKKGLYRSYPNVEQYHAYTNAMILACGAVSDEKRVKNICAALRNPEKHNVVEMSLAYFSLKYDVLIEYDDGLDFVINQICDIFGEMLFKGATSYPETILGEMDFTGAGSLCHGWSAVACYVLDKYYQPRVNSNKNQK